MSSLENFAPHFIEEEASPAQAKGPDASQSPAAPKPQEKADPAPDAISEASKAQAPAKTHAAKAPVKAPAKQAPKAPAKPAAKPAAKAPAKPAVKPAPKAANAEESKTMPQAAKAAALAQELAGAMNPPAAFQQACQDFAALLCADPASESRNSVSARHRSEWRIFRKHFIGPLYGEPSPDAAKFSKALADILKLYQEGERKAWGFVEGGEEGGALDVSWEE